jgi:RND family efflux transporter MFP subunit
MSNERNQNEPRSAARLLWFLAPVAVLAIGALFTVHSKAASETKVAATTNKLAVQHVAVVHPQRGNPITELSLPGTTEAFVESPIFARTNGYVKLWTKDIGARVQSGELLAEIETPELDQQVQQSRAVLAQSEANLKLANITSSRYRDLIGSHSVSQQDVDQADQNVAMLTASTKAASADVQRLEQLQQFERVLAPFDGIVTARNVNIGDLINAGSATASKEMFRIAKIDTLRVFVNVPEDYGSSIRPGVAARLAIAGFPGKEFPARVARYTHAVDPNSRTMRTEIDVPNPSGVLIPGAYASAIFSLRSAVAPLILPSNTELFQANGLQVAVVDQKSAVQLRNITVGRDFGTSVEVISGLQPKDSVITNPSDSLNSGQQVAVSNTNSSVSGS